MQAAFEPEECKPAAAPTSYAAVKSLSADADEGVHCTHLLLL